MYIQKQIIKNKKGMTILELTVAIALLGLCLIPITQAFPYSSAIIGSAKNTTIASYVAQEKIEELISLDYENVGIGMVETRHSLDTPESAYLASYEREATVVYVDGTDLLDSATDTGLKKITVNVYYIDRVSRNENIFSINSLLVRK